MNISSSFSKYKHFPPIIVERMVYQFIKWIVPNENGYLIRNGTCYLLSDKSPVVAVRVFLKVIFINQYKHLTKWPYQEME